MEHSTMKYIYILVTALTYIYINSLHGTLFFFFELFFWNTQQSSERRKLKEMKRVTVQEMDRHGIEMSALSNAMISVVRDNTQEMARKESKREEKFRNEKFKLENALVDIKNKKIKNEQERNQKITTREKEFETIMNALNVEISKVKVEHETFLEQLRNEHELSTFQKNDEKKRQSVCFEDLKQKRKDDQKKHIFQINVWKKKEEEERKKYQVLEIILQETRDKLIESVSKKLFILLDYLSPPPLTQYL